MTGPDGRSNVLMLLRLVVVIAFASGGDAKATVEVEWGDANNAADDAVEVEHPHCRLYLAESTIPNAGLGIFTGIDLQPHQPVAEPDIVVPLHDQAWHAGEDLDFWFLWGEYSWQISEVEMDSDMEDGSALVIGTGCMPNCNFALINAHEGKPDYDHAGLHRSKDVGTSGFTGFHNQRMITTRDIPRGGEIFVDYGEAWFEDRTETVGPVPFGPNYMRVDKFLKKFRKLSLKHQTSENPEFTRDLWDVVQTTRSYQSRNSAALPLSFADMRSAQAVGAAETRLPYSVRSTEWLDEHGRCMDNIRPGNSTVAQAGRGAFASRFIAKGGLVAPGPVLHIANRTSLNVYDADDNYERDTNRPIGMQLILNYCFGHGRSSLILCPYTSPSAYINHDGEAPNAKVVWADDATPNHNPEWLQEDVNFLKKMGHIGLSLDYVATRDIQPGEEVFIDYGPEWEEAWNEYVKEWTPPVGSKKYAPASTLQEPLRTAKEQRSEPYPNNVVFYCHYDYVPGTHEGPWVWQDEWIELRLNPCKLLSREEDGVDLDGKTMYYYSLVMLTQDDFVLGDGILSPEERIPSGENHILVDVPRWAIEVRDKLYTKDEFLRNTFRHEMMIPDEIFPAVVKMSVLLIQGNNPRRNTLLQYQNPSPLNNPNTTTNNTAYNCNRS